MRGSIIKRSENSYRIKVSLGKDPATGKYIAHFETVKGNKKAAEQRLSELLHQKDTGTFTPPGKLTVKEHLEQWLKGYVRSNLSGSTYELYDIMAHKHIIPVLGQIPLTQLKPQHLQQFYSDKLATGLSNRIIQIMHFTLHKSFQNAVKTGILMRNPMDAVDCPKIQHHEMKVMSESDIHLFLEMARPTEYYSLFYTLLFTGLRRSEAIALRWCDVGLLSMQISVTRTM